MTRFRWLAPIVMTLSCAVAAQPALAQDSATFAIEGQVVNGTVGADAPGGVRVQAYAYTSERIDGPWETQTDETGAYRIEGVSAVDGAVYVLGVDYADA